jgi:hypothetical protein
MSDVLSREQVECELRIIVGHCFEGSTKDGARNLILAHDAALRQQLATVEQERDKLRKTWKRALEELSVLCTCGGDTRHNDNCIKAICQAALLPLADQTKEGHP